MAHKHFHLDGYISPNQRFILHSWVRSQKVIDGNKDLTRLSKSVTIIIQFPNESILKLELVKSTLF